MNKTEWTLSQGADALLLQHAQRAFPGNTPAKIGVAVSGGSDSLALLHLCARVQAHRGGQVRAVTVDHRLRPEGAKEARAVAAFCKTLGIRHDTLVWQHGAIAGNLQDQARRARYALIGDWARMNDIGHVVLGHTADDQAETFLMELAREAGIDGLSGMRRNWTDDGIAWARPLLDERRDGLRAYLARHDISWIDDPSNADQRFARVRARGALKALQPLGITTETLNSVVRNLQSVRQTVQVATADAGDRIAKTSAGELVFDRREFQRLPEEVMRRLLAGSLRWVSGEKYAPRHASLTRVQAAVRDIRDKTLSGCRIRVSETEIRIVREPKAVAGLETASQALWDDRWRLVGPHDRRLTVRALGTEGLRQCDDWRATGHSRSALIVSPAIWRGATLIAAPLAGMGNAWTAEIVASFHSFLLSH
ncbi:MAG: tRNA lysidine(34) synthetase TilS [Paracoccaceae bacterium]